MAWKRTAMSKSMSKGSVMWVESLSQRSRLVLQAGCKGREEQRVRPSGGGRTMFSLRGRAVHTSGARS
eukprot:6302580-Amphidinium_carterae.1